MLSIVMPFLRSMDHETQTRKRLPWLTGHLGDPTAAVWFLGLYPSLTPVERIDRISPVKSPNLQWSCNDRGARLWREAVAEAGLKDGPSCQDCGWHCYITNVIKEVMGLKEQKLMKTKLIGRNTL